MKLKNWRKLLLGLFPWGAFLMGFLGVVALELDGTPLSTGTATAIMMVAAVLCIICQGVLTYRYYRCPKCGAILQGQRSIPLHTKHCPDCGCEIDYDTVVPIRTKHKN